MLGERASLPVSRSIAPDIDALSSWSARGTRMAQPLSRKWRLISPTTFGRGVGGERHVARELEAVDRLDQPDGAHLLDVLQRLAAPGVAARQRAHERQVALDQLLARRRVALVVVAAQQLAVLAASLRRRGGAMRGGAHVYALRFSRRTITPSPSTSSTPNESTTVLRMRSRVSWPGRESPSRSASVMARSSQRPHARADRLLADLEAQVDGVASPGLGQQPLHRQLEVVDLLEREVHPLRDAADDQPDRPAGSRATAARRGRSAPCSGVTSPPRSSRSPSPGRPTRRQASCPGATAWAGRASSSSSVPSAASATRHGIVRRAVAKADGLHPGRAAVQQRALEPHARDGQRLARARP